MTARPSEHPVPIPIPIACTLQSKEFAAREAALKQHLFSAVEETRELPDGYAFRFPGGDEWKQPLYDFVDAERICCPFLRIELTFEPAQGPIWLRLTGAEGVKAFVRETFAPREKVH